MTPTAALHAWLPAQAADVCTAARQDSPWAPLLMALLVLALGFGAGALARLVARHRARSVTWAESTLAGVVGAALGAGVVDARITDNGDLDGNLLIGALVGAAASTVFTVVLILWWAQVKQQRARRNAWRSVADLITDGENERLEFKQTARRNAHTGERDDRLEMVVVKTVAGFLNAEGGVLLIGVADDGTVTGCEVDYTLVKQADRDRYQLFLRDLLTTCLGGPAGALVAISFEEVDGHDVCRLDIPRAPAPVFVDTPKGTRTADFFVRMGNSTRPLLSDETLDYARRHFPS